MAKTLVEVLTEQKIELIESSNGRWVALCPFHTERSPSFTIYPNESYYCFGCQVWGNPVKFLVDYKGMTGQEALEYVGVDYKLPKSEKRVIKVKNLLMTSTFLYDVAQKYHDYLLENLGPQKYLTDRGLTMKTIVRHKIGYSDGAVLNLQFAEEYNMANEVGLLNKGGYEIMAHRIIIPNIVDHRYVDFMMGRTVINDKVKYLGLRMPKPMMGFYDVRHSPIVFMVEGQFDWLLLRQWNYPAIVMSGSHITRANGNLLKDKQIIYVPDNDPTGVKAGNEIKRMFPSAIIMETAEFGTKDISEYAQFNPDAQNFFDAAVEDSLCDIPSSILATYEKWLPISIDTTQLVST